MCKCVSLLPIKKSLLLVGFFIILGCSKYQVVQEVRVNMYHLHNPKTKDAEIIVTKDTLEIGKFYRLNQINIIDLSEDL